MLNALSVQKNMSSLKIGSLAAKGRVIYARRSSCSFTTSAPFANESFLHKPRRNLLANSSFVNSSLYPIRYAHAKSARTVSDPEKAAPPAPVGPKGKRNTMTAAQAAAILGKFIGIPDLRPAEPVAMDVQTLYNILHTTLNEGSQADNSHNAQVKELKQALFAHSAAVTEQFLGPNVYYRGLIEFSNVCVCDCEYCGIRKHQPGLERFTVPIEEVVEVAEWAFQKKYGSVMLQSGELPTPQRMEYLLKMIQRIREGTIALDEKEHKGLGISVSVGELEREDYEKLFQAGAHRYLLRIETSNPALFAKLHPPKQTFEHRLKCLRTLKELGFQVGTGVMIGLPGQTLLDLARDIVFFREEGMDMIGMGPYIPSQGTPTAELWKSLIGDHKEHRDKHMQSMFELTTIMIALCRITMGNVNLAATTALQALNPSGREIALERGANILMPILTPLKYREKYQLYDGKPCITDTPAQCQSCLEMRVDFAGKKVAYGQWGDPRHYFQKDVGGRVMPESSPSNVTITEADILVTRAPDAGEKEGSSGTGNQQRRYYSTSTKPAAEDKKGKKAGGNLAESGSTPIPRINIGIFGLMNSGKSTLINRITRQATSIVDSKPGTTADVKIALMEVHGIGPTKMFDTAGVDEEGELGLKKLNKGITVLKESDLVLLVVDPSRGPLTQLQKEREQLVVDVAIARKRTLAIIYNTRQRNDMTEAKIQTVVKEIQDNFERSVAANSTESPAKAHKIPSTIIDLNNAESTQRITAWLTTLLHVGESSVEGYGNPVLPPKYLTPAAFIFLNIPMDAETPGGRLLRPQAQVQEQVLRQYGSTLAYRMDLAKARSPKPELREEERKRFLTMLAPVINHPGPKILVTDSQAMDIVHPWTLDENKKPIIEITTFSICMIQQQNKLELFVGGIRAYQKLGPDARVLITEGCNHNLMTTNCDDISTGQLPRAIKGHAGPNVTIDHAFGREFPEMSSEQYQLAIHCGGCMLDRQKQHARISDLEDAKVPVTNYGFLLSYVQGPDALTRTLAPWGVNFTD